MKYFIQVFGCQMNRSDAERISGIFESLGLEPAQNFKDTDVFVAVMCSVRQMATNRIFGLEQKIELAKKNNSRFKSILTGCIVENDKERFLIIFDHVLSIKTLSQWPEILGLADKSNIDCDYLKFFPKRISQFSSLISISKGCDNYCTYCVVPYTRGGLESRPAEDILDEVRQTVDEGTKEIWLLGQNVNNYHSGEINFAKLLKLVNDINGDFWIRFTSPHPKDFTREAVLAMAQCQKVTPYLNLPIQSGDDAILKAMNRPYNLKIYKKLVTGIRGAFKKYRLGVEKNVAISTDVIVGFPGETKVQFLNTAKAFKSIKFDMAYIAQYSRRAGTNAAKLDDSVALTEKKRREETINNILKITALDHNKKYIGKIVPVLVDSTKGDCFGLGKTRSYKTVKFKLGKITGSIVGTFVNIKIVKAQSFGLIGNLVKNGK